MKRLLKSVGQLFRRGGVRVPTPRPAPPHRPTTGGHPTNGGRSTATGRPGAPARWRDAPAPTPTGGRHLVYAPELDGQADPGEIVWTWVAYEDQPQLGKDRPVLVVGRNGATLLGLMLSSQSDRDGQRHWYALGPGVWDRQSRPSWVRLDRVLEVDEDGIRREGAVLDRARFDAVARVLRTSYGWA